MKIANALGTATLGIALALITAASAAAQEELLPPEGGAFAPEDLPPDEAIETPGLSALSEKRSEAAEILRPWYEHRAEPDRLIDACPALMESTGTWIRRGFWYAEADAMLMNRRFNRGTVVLGREMGAAASAFTVVTFNNVLQIDNGPGAEALPRLTFGRFLFRDEMNRDHTAEFVWFGGGDWNQSASLQSGTSNGLSVPTSIDVSNNLDLPNEGIRQAQLSNISFDGADAMNFAYGGEFDSFELNYNVKDRMARDQMILKPSGEWVRSATPSRTHSFLAGLRFVNTADHLDWNATGVPDVTAADPDADIPRNDGTGSYSIDADNYLLGTQLGFGVAYERDRWSLGVKTKGGGYLNFMNVESQFAVINGEDTTLNSGTVELEETNLSFIGEIEVQGKWHLRPNLSLRAGVELLYIESIALATNQISFAPGGSTTIADGGDNVFLGTSIGLETYW